MIIIIKLYPYPICLESVDVSKADTKGYIEMVFTNKEVNGYQIMSSMVGCIVLNDSHSSYLFSIPFVFGECKDKNNKCHAMQRLMQSIVAHEQVKKSEIKPDIFISKMMQHTSLLDDYYHCRRTHTDLKVVQQWLSDDHQIKACTDGNDCNISTRHFRRLDDGDEEKSENIDIDAETKGMYYKLWCRIYMNHKFCIYFVQRSIWNVPFKN